MNDKLPFGVGPQYPPDDEFKKRARIHQSKYRSEILGVDFDEYGNRLTEKDAKNGLNFHTGFSIFNQVKKRYPNYNKGLYADMLRSEHIPFNFFIPLKENLALCKDIFNELLGGNIQTIDKKCIIDNGENIKIEFAPEPKESFLNDRTSFDTYIEYVHKDGNRGIIGIEVKYTEKEYVLKNGSNEYANVSNKESLYFQVMKKANIYKPNTSDILITDEFRQIWRNHLLGESLLIADSRFKYFSSVIFFPQGNKHFYNISRTYMENILLANDNHFVAVTYEQYFALCAKYANNTDYKNWSNYLTQRYILHN